MTVAVFSNGCASKSKGFGMRGEVVSLHVNEATKLRETRDVSVQVLEIDPATKRARISISTNTNSQTAWVNEGTTADFSAIVGSKVIRVRQVEKDLVTFLFMWPVRR
jgi:hypothetical protein